MKFLRKNLTLNKCLIIKSNLWMALKQQMMTLKHLNRNRVWIQRTNLRMNKVFKRSARVLISH